MQVEKYFSGPLPAPEVLEHFDRVHPGTAAVIVDTYKLQVTTRISREDRVVDGRIAAEKRGQWLSFVLGASGLMLALFFGLRGMGEQAIVAIIGGVVPIALATVNGLLRKS